MRVGEMRMSVIADARASTSCMNAANVSSIGLGAATVRFTDRIT